MTDVLALAFVIRQTILRPEEFLFFDLYTKWHKFITTKEVMPTLIAWSAQLLGIHPDTIKGSLYSFGGVR
jgi:hypothetical protein